MTAVLSPCGHYRYRLTRPGDILTVDKGPALFVMLNPSTADADMDDPTVRRCRSFSRLWGHAGIIIANLYALRSTDPAGLWAHPDPVGPENDRHLAALASDFGDVVCAWGGNARLSRVNAVADIFLAAGARLWCLGTTDAGAPRHPLYVSGFQPLVPWKK